MRDFVTTLGRAGDFKPRHCSFLELSIYYFRARLTRTLQKAELWVGGGYRNLVLGGQPSSSFPEPSCEVLSLRTGGSAGAAFCVSLSEPR